MKFAVDLRSVRTETIRLEVDAPSLEEAQEKAREVAKTARALGPWSVEEDFVDVEDVQEVVS